MVLYLPGYVQRGIDAQTPPPTETVFETPIQLQAKSGAAAVNKPFEGLRANGHGYAGPHLTDFDGDATPDLLVGDIFGYVYFFKGLGAEAQASYAAPTPLRMVDGEAIQFANWWYTSLRPQLVDFNSDGRKDLIAGGFGGQCCYTPGTEAGFGAPITIQDENGNDGGLGKHYNFEKNKYDSMDPMPFAEDVSEQARDDRSEGFTVVDWDNDGDLDILMGATSGRLYLRKNIGARTKPIYAALTKELLSMDGQEMTHAIPVVADWDKDGLFDIFSSGTEGAVLWFRNTGRLSEPAFAVAQALVTPTQVKENVSVRSGKRAIVEACDYDSDGYMDLIVGDMKGFIWLYIRR